MNSDINIIIADDHPLFRRGLREAIEEVERFHIVAECTNGSDALERIQSLLPDVAILDMQMPEMGGLEVASTLQKGKNTTALVFLTVHDDQDMFHRAMELGARGYILKDAVVSEIVQGIDIVAAGEYYFSPQLSSRWMRENERLRNTVDAQTGLSRLTVAERRILSLIAEELTTEQIAEMLCISPRTVEHHRSNINHKLSLNGAYALVRFALKHRKYL